MSLAALVLITLVIVLLLVVIHFSPFDVKAKSLLQIGIVVLLLLFLLFSSPVVRGTALP